MYQYCSSSVATVISQKKLRNNVILCWHLESHRRKEQVPYPDPDLDPDQNVTDPELLYIQSLPQMKLVNQLYSAVQY